MDCAAVSESVADVSLKSQAGDLFNPVFIRSEKIYPFESGGDFNAGHRKSQRFSTCMRKIFAII